MSQELQTLVEADMFDINGPVSINYTRTSIQGIPLFAYKDAEFDLNFSGDEIGRTATPHGEAVTVTLRPNADAGERLFTLLLPKITLSFGDSVEFDTLGFETDDRSQAHVLPPGPEGVLQTYRVHQLHGVAQAVVS